MKTGLSAQCFGLLRNDIVNGTYPAGSRLPSERQLSAQYKASRFAIREAIAMLVQNGFAETFPQRGTFVRNYRYEGTLETLVQTLHTRRIIEKDTLDSLLRFRYNIETNASAEAAGRIRENDIEHLLKILARKKEHERDRAILSECDYDFHFAVIDISADIVNRMIFQTFRPIYSFFTGFFYSIPEAAKTSLALNHALVDAFLQRNAELSSSAMGNILKYGEQKVYEAIRGGGNIIVMPSLVN